MNCGLIDCYVEEEMPEWGEGLIVLAEGEPSVTATFELSLGSQPSSDAALSIVSDDTSQVTVYPETLTFTSSNWDSPQTVIITVVDDDYIDHNIDPFWFTTVTVSGVGSNWIDDEETLWVYVGDDDGLDWHLERYGETGNVEISETGSQHTIELKLWSQPSSDAVLSIVSDDTGEVAVSPATLTFTGSNWDSLQAVTFTGVDDTDLDGYQTTTVTVSGVGDDWESSGETLTVITTDDEVLDWHVDRGNDATPDTSYLVGVSETGSTSEFGIVLKYQPVSGDEVVSIVSGDTGEVTASPATLTFTGSNWESMQTVTLTGVDDTDVDGDQTTTITISGVGPGLGAGWASDETLYVVTEDDDVTLPNELIVAFDSGVEGETWGNGTFSRCDAGLPCGALSSGIFGGREVYVKPHANSHDPSDDWYYAYIFHKWAGATWIIQYVSPALTDSAGNYLWNAHRYGDCENPWDGDCNWSGLTVSQQS